MYRKIRLILYCFRLFATTNPFWFIGKNAFLVNAVSGLVLGRLTYWEVGQFYVAGTEPALGSVLYTVGYLINSKIIEWICMLFPSIWLVSVACIAYLGLIVFLVSRYR